MATEGGDRICDFCTEIGDHDRPYAVGDVAALRARFTRDEFCILATLRRHINDVKQGHAFGLGFGDLSTDDPLCSVCNLPLHVHKPMALCRTLDLTSET